MYSCIPITTIVLSTADTTNSYNCYYILKVIISNDATLIYIYIYIYIYIHTYVFIKEQGCIAWI